MELHLKAVMSLTLLADTPEITLHLCFDRNVVDTEVLHLAFYLFVSPRQPLQSKSIKSVFLMRNFIVCGMDA